MKPAIFRDAINGDLVLINPAHIVYAVEVRRGVAIQMIGNVSITIDGTVGAMYNAFLQ